MTPSLFAPPQAERRSLVGRVLRVLAFDDAEIVESFFAATALMIGTLLLWPGSYFRGRHVFDGLASLASEEVWGGVLVLYGIAGVFGLVKRLASIRNAVALAGVSLYALLAWKFLLGGSTPFSESSI